MVAWVIMPLGVWLEVTVVVWLMVTVVELLGRDGMFIADYNMVCGGHGSMVGGRSSMVGGGRGSIVGATWVGWPLETIVVWLVVGVVA